MIEMGVHKEEWWRQDQYTQDTSISHNYFLMPRRRDRRYWLPSQVFPAATKEVNQVLQAYISHWRCSSLGTPSALINLFMDISRNNLYQSLNKCVCVERNVGEYGPETRRGTDLTKNSWRLFQCPLGKPSYHRTSNNSSAASASMRVL